MNPRMLSSSQVSSFDEPSDAFFGVRFVLIGFDSVRENQVRLKLLEGGGVDDVDNGPKCTHVVVDKLVYDDPICVAARRDGKILVTGLWVDHSFDMGMAVDSNFVIYWPLRDLNGIPGAKSLVICLTGYERQDRDDIKTMVSLMGAKFSKPLVPNMVTHLICYKFEGEKYELARKLSTIILVNHQWVENSLMAWELLPEADYATSGYELEMKAEVKETRCGTQSLSRENLDEHPKKSGNTNTPVDEGLTSTELTTHSNGAAVAKNTNNAEKLVESGGYGSETPSRKLSRKREKTSDDVEMENEPLTLKADADDFDTNACFILTGLDVERKEFRQVIKRLKGRLCKETHIWSYQATHYIVPEPIRRTEKLFAAAASGSWILKSDYLTACNKAGRFLSEEPYEWWRERFLTEDGAINLEAPRKWRLLKEKTGHGAFYGIKIIVYGDYFVPSLETLKRVVKAGDGTILATSPPYTRILESEVDFAILAQGIPYADTFVQEFLRREIPIVSPDYLVDFVCRPGLPLDRHVLYETQAWAERSLASLLKRLEEPVQDHDVACRVCGMRDREEVMLLCGDESGTYGCDVGTHIDCLDPPLEKVPEEDWFCEECCRKKRDESRQLELEE